MILERILIDVIGGGDCTLKASRDKRASDFIIRNLGVIEEFGEN